MNRKMVGIVAVLATMPLWAETEFANGYTWTYRINGETAEIYNAEKAPIYNYNDVAISPRPNGAVTIPSTLGGKPVSIIGENALRGCGSMVSVTIPDSVTGIGKTAFYGCSGLASVMIGKGVTNIGSTAFCDCTNLTSIVIPDSVMDIGYAAFRFCSGLTSVSFGNGVTSIGEYAFSGCSDLKSATIPNGVTNIGENAFSECSALTSVVIPDSVTSIGWRAFANCSSIKSVTVPQYVLDMRMMKERCLGGASYSGIFASSAQFITNINYSGVITHIVDSAFDGCSGLMSVTIPDGVTRIGEYAFCDCTGLTCVTIPDSVTSIGSSAFAGCSGLTSVTISQLGVNSFRDVFSGYNALSVNMSDSVTSIGNSAFSGCRGLACITIPDGVTSIGEYAFYGCSGLTSVTLGKDITSIGWCAFYGCSGLTCVSIPDSVTSIDGKVFSFCSGLTNITIPDSVTRMGVGVFSGCSSLVTMTLPFYGRTRASNEGFYSLFGSYADDPSIIPGSLKEVILTDVEIIGSSAFYGCSSLTSVVIPNGVTNIGNWAFHNCSGLTSVTIPGSVTSIGNDAFRDCSGLTSVTIGNSVTSIGEDAFSGCSGLTSVMIPQSVCSSRMSTVFPSAYSKITNVIISASVTSIGSHGFDGCGRLTSVTIPDSVTSIDASAFFGCSELTGVYITDIAKWCQLSFKNNDANPLYYAKNLYLNGSLVRGLTIPDSVTSIGEYVFQNCRGLTSVTIPGSVTSIGTSAFGGCSGLTSVAIPESVTRIGVGAFDGCTSLRSIELPEGLTDWGLDSLPPAMSEKYEYDTNGLMIVDGWLLDCRDKTLSVLTVPEGVVGIGSCALAQMYDLETVNLPQSLKYIATGAFREDTYLDNLVIPDGVEIVGESAFEDCSFIQTMTLGSRIKSVGVRAFAGCTHLSGAVFADGLLDVGAEAFDGCWRMQSVSLPLSTTNVASTAFNGCTALTGVTVPTHGGRMSEWFAPVYSQICDVTVPEGETEVRAEMFRGCSSLRSISLPEGITNIDESAFWGCSSLLEIMLPETLVAVGDYAFCECFGLKAMVLPERVERIGQASFADCGNLSEMTLSRNLSAIPDFAFAFCYSLDSLVVPASVASIGMNFNQGGGIKAIYYLGNAPACDDAYLDANRDLVSYVILGTKGWDGRPNSRDIPASWNGRDILTWSANQFDVTFDANGGLFFPVVTNTYACEETTYTGYSLPPFEPVRKGMDFDGYWTEPGGGTRVFTSTRVLLTKPHTLYAHWKKGSTIKVRFNACGGTVSPAEDDYVSERPYCELPVPVREHFAFDGWWTEASGGSRIEISSEVPKAAHELFAHWTPASYTIRFHANNGTGETVDQYFTYGDAVTLRTNTFGNSSNIFAGWALSGNGPAVYADGKTLTDVVAIQDNVIHLYAVWVDAHYTVRFDSHGGTGRMENQTLVKDTAAALYDCTFTRTGYTFAGWAVSTTGGVVYGDGESVVNVYEKTGADVVLYAVWQEASTPAPEPEPTPEPEEAPVICEDPDGSAPSAVASAYDGYLYNKENGALAGTVQIKVGKPNKNTGLASVKATLQLTGQKKLTLKAVEKGKAQIASDGPTDIEFAGGEVCVVTLGAYGMSGYYGAYEIDGSRNVFTSKDKSEASAAAKAIEKWVGAYVVMWDGGTASVTIDKKGKAKASVTLSGGAKGTATSQLLFGDEWMCVPVMVAKKMDVAFTLWLPADGGEVVVTGLGDDVVAGRGGALKSGAAFRIDEDEFAAVTGIAALPYLPDGVSVEPKGTKWVVAGGAKAGKVAYRRGTQEVDEAKLGDNPSGLKLTYKAKDGSFKGSFKAYAEVKGKLKATTVSVSGTVLNGVGYGTATVKGKGSVPVTIE